MREDRDYGAILGNEDEEIEGFNQNNNEEEKK